jgi:hypothetical protein
LDAALLIVLLLCIFVHWMWQTPPPPPPATATVVAADAAEVALPMPAVVSGCGLCVCVCLHACMLGHLSFSAQPACVWTCDPCVHHQVQEVSPVSSGAPSPLSSSDAADARPRSASRTKKAVGSLKGRVAAVRCVEGRPRAVPLPHGPQSDACITSCSTPYVCAHLYSTCHGCGGGMESWFCQVACCLWFLAFSCSLSPHPPL